MFLDLQQSIAELFEEAQLIQPEWARHRLVDYLARRHQAKLECGRDYYKRVRTKASWRAKENAAISAKRCAARLERAAKRPPCPHCNGPVERGAVVTRGTTLPKYCSRRLHARRYLEAVPLEATR